MSGRPSFINDRGEPESSILVLVPDAEPVVNPWRQRYDPLAPVGVAAHVTLLYPFLPPHEIDETVVAELRRVLGEFEPFDFAFRETGRFPGVLFLKPEPAEPFIAMTKAIVRRWPQCAPYGGRYDTVVPHSTVGHLDDPARLDELDKVITPGLPIETQVSSAWLLVQDDDGNWWVRSRLGLGSAAQSDAR